MADINAQEVSVETDKKLNLLHIWFIEDFDQPKLFVITRNTTANDTIYHIEYCDQSFGCDNGIASMTLSRERLEVRLDDRGKRHLKQDGFLIRFTLSDVLFADLQQALWSIFPAETLPR